MLLLIHPFISSFFFLFNFQTLKFFVILFSGTVRLRRLKLGTHVDSGQMYCVYRNQAAAAICPFISPFCFLSHFQIIFSGTKRPMTFKVGMQHWVLEYYQICSTDDHGMTLTSFTARSNLVPYAFAWEKGKTIIVFRNYCSL